MPSDAIRVRPSKPSDLQLLADIERQAAIDPWTLSQFVFSSVRNNQHILVAESAADEVLGFAIFQQVADEANLLNIAVRPDQQGRGVGVVLMRTLLEELAERELRRCLLEVRRGNPRAIALYRGHGFVEDGVRRNYYPLKKNEREDALLMSCEVVAKQ